MTLWAWSWKPWALAGDPQQNLPFAGTAKKPVRRASLLRRMLQSVVPFSVPGGGGVSWRTGGGHSWPEAEICEHPLASRFAHWAPFKRSEALFWEAWASKWSQNGRQNRDPNLQKNVFNGIVPTLSSTNYLLCSKHISKPRNLTNPPRIA